MVALVAVRVHGDEHVRGAVVVALFVRPRREYVDIVRAAEIAKLGLRNNTVAAPLSGVRPGIRIDAGNNNVSDDAVCLNISGNTTGGSGGHEGIGLRKQGTVTATHDFGIEGMAATGAPGVEQYVGNGPGGQNPGSANGSFGVNRVLLISGTSGFSNCSTAP